MLLRLTVRTEVLIRPDFYLNVLLPLITAPSWHLKYIYFFNNVIHVKQSEHIYIFSWFILCRHRRLFSYYGKLCLYSLCSKEILISPSRAHVTNRIHNPVNYLVLTFMRYINKLVVCTWTIVYFLKFGRIWFIYTFINFHIVNVTFTIWHL